MITGAPDGAITVTVAPSVSTRPPASVTATTTSYDPGRSYSWVPERLPKFGGVGDVGSTFSVGVPSPQLIVAVNESSGTDASENVALTVTGDVISWLPVGALTDRINGGATCTIWKGADPDLALPRTSVAV